MSDTSKLDKEASDAKPDETKAGMPLHEHLRELRKRLIYSLLSFLLVFMAGFYFAKGIFNFLVAPLQNIWLNSGGSEARGMIFTAMHEQFITEIKVAMFLAFLVTMPLILIQIWMFVAPGLYKNEKRVFVPFMVATPLLFVLGASFVYYLVLPAAWHFFLGFEQASSAEAVAITLEPKVNEYLSLVMRLIFAFGLCFELPVLLLLLVQAGITSAQGLRKKRRYAIVVAFVVAAVLTPPDPLSQLGLAIPIILLYELSILGALLLSRKKKDFSD
ncbi:MAG: twin-arginine translocase subunit TatC [Alphaproteobacteria bacterium]|nr:twin-arginine translocase subunit TatC [Alphaproteobacteria bacterium]